MRGRLKLIAALVCAVLAIFACIAYADLARAQVIRERDAALERYGGELVRLVVSNTGLEPGDVISRTNVSEREWLSDLAPEAAITNIDDVLGKTVGVPLAQGAPLTQLTFREDRHVLDVPSGHVALAIPVSDKLGISEAMTYGSKVLAFESTSEYALPIASEILIIGMPTQQNTLANAPAITLAVLPEDVQSILVAASSANLRLVMPASDLDAVAQKLVVCVPSTQSDSVSIEKGDSEQSTKKGESA